MSLLASWNKWWHKFHASPVTPLAPTTDPFDSAMHTLQDAAVSGKGCSLNHAESDAIFRTMLPYLRNH